MAKRKELRFVAKVSPKPMSPEDREIATDLLAKLIARAIIAEHAEAYGPGKSHPQGDQSDPDKCPDDSANLT